MDPDNEQVAVDQLGIIITSMYIKKITATYMIILVILPMVLGRVPPNLVLSASK